MGLFRRDKSADAMPARSMTLGQLGLQYGVDSRNIDVSSPLDALRASAVFACIDLLATTASSLPLIAVKHSSSEKPGDSILHYHDEPVTPQPRLLRDPCPCTDIDVWVYQIMWSMATAGNVYGRILDTDRLGYPIQITLIDPRMIDRPRLVDGHRVVDIGGKTEHIYPYGDIWHATGKMAMPGSPFGLSPLEYASRSIGTSIQAERFGGDFFAAGGMPTGVLYSETELDATQAGEAKRRFMTSTENREPVVLGTNYKYDPIRVDPSDSQFIDLMRFEVEQICRFWRVPPTMIYSAVSGQNVTYVNASQADLAYLKHSVDGYLNRVESALDSVVPSTMSVRFNRDALLRADTQTRYATYKLGIDGGWLTDDEVRELEGRPPLTKKQREQQQAKQPQPTPTSEEPADDEGSPDSESTPG